MSAVVKIYVNEKALISNLKMSFATGTTWVTELLQNARRAGATQIHILLNHDQKEFTIADDGQGIDDMQHLFSIAESGWDEPVLSEEKPYGMGFLSCLFACETVQIISQKQEVNVVTKNAIAFDDIHVRPHPGVAGTFIRMQGVTNMPTANFLQKAVKGFPVPVYLNGSTTPLENCHAVGAMDWDETEIGLIHISRLDRRFYEPVIYLQGLPINAGYRLQYYDNNVIVHLDSAKFFGRLPDRESVIDPDKASIAITSAIINLYTAKLHQMKMEMLADGQAQEFIARYGEVCMAYCKKMLNDVPFLPGAAIGGEVYDLDCNVNNSRLAYPATPVSKESVVDKTVTLFSGNDGCYDMENMPHMALIQAYDGIIVRAENLDSEHWVHPYVHHLKSDIRIALTEQQPTFTINGRYVFGNDVILGEVLTLSGSFEVGGNPVEIGCTCDETVFESKEERFYVPAASKGYRAVGQASDYLDDDVYCEDVFEEDDNLFIRLVSEARNPDPASLLQQLLLDIGFTKYPSLKERSFQVTIGNDGTVKVALS